jgi:transposase InsO family protein
MDVHQNARLTPHCRALLVERVQRGQSKASVAMQFGISFKTLEKWLDRYRQEGAHGLLDRSSRPRRSPRATVREVALAVLALRRHRLTLESIALQLGLSRATVGRICQRAGLNRLSKLEPVPQVVRYERAKPGELLHLDIKKLGRIMKIGSRITGRRDFRPRTAGWEHVHVAIDDNSRVAYTQVMNEEDGAAAGAFLRAAVAYYAGLGITVKEIMTDNGGCYRCHAFRKVRESLGLRHRFTKAYTPRTNGKAERFIQTALREWAYARAYHNSNSRSAELPQWLHRYNWHRPHASLAGQPPISRLGLEQDNVLRLHS